MTPNQIRMAIVGAVAALTYVSWVALAWTRQPDDVLHSLYAVAAGATLVLVRDMLPAAPHKPDGPADAPPNP